TAGVGHEDGLVQTEQCDGNEIADEEVRLDERACERREEPGQEDVEHSLLRVLGADLDDLLRVCHRCGSCALEVHVRLDELDCAICTGRHGLGGCADEPVNDSSPGYEPKQERRMEQREIREEFRLKSVRQ